MNKANLYFIFRKYSLLLAQVDGTKTKIWILIDYGSKPGIKKIFWPEYNTVDI